MGQLVFIVHSALSAGAGDVVGPGSSVNNNVVAFDGISGQLIKDSGIPAAAFGGDAGAGGVIGFVPAPAAGDAANFRYLNANGTWEQLSEDQILPGFAISSFTKSAPSLVLRGQGVGAGSTVSILYTSGPPASAALSNVNTGVLGAGTAPTAWTGLVGPAFSGATQPNNVAYDGDDTTDPVWTINLSATKPPTKNASLTVQWTRQVFWEASAAPGPISNAAFPLTNNVLSPAKGRTITLVFADEYLYYSFPAAYGTVTMKDADTGFAIGLETPYDITGVVSGISSTYRVYRSTQKLTGTFNIQVT